MKTGSKVLLSAGLIASFMAPILAGAAKISSIDFVNSDKSSDITIHSDAPITFEKAENAGDKQIVLDLKDSTLSKAASRKMDTSSFDSKVILVSPYSVSDGKDSRVVLQLRDMASATVTQDGNVIKVSVPNEGGASAAADVPPAPEAPPVESSAPAPTAAKAAPTTAAAVPSEDVGSTAPDASVDVSKTAPAAAPAPTSAAPKDKLGQFIENRDTGRFTGKAITLKVRDADIMDVFRLISDTSGFNIVVGDDVKGKITLSLEGVPWDQALDVILRTQKLGAERTHNILRIVTLQNLTAEKQAEFAAKQATEQNAPRITRIFPVSFAKLDDLVQALVKLSVEHAPIGAAASAGGAAPALTSNAIVQKDDRTNSIIVRDTVENVERMRKLIEILDTQTPQVMIEGKVVEASEQFNKSISGNLGFGKSDGTGQYFSSFNGANPIDPLFSLGSTGQFTGTTAGTGSAGGGSFGLSPVLSFLPGNVRLNAFLNLSESEQNIRVVSSPKVVVLDKEAATIVEGTPVLIQTVQITANGPISTPTIQSANLSMNVTPTITNEGSVLMQLALSRDVPQPAVGASGSSSTSGVASRNMSTKVLVESGSTLVMGGIYTSNQTNGSSGFPILRKIPILGALFGSETDNNQKSELFFFITPRILNAKESGIAGST